MLADLDSTERPALLLGHDLSDERSDDGAANHLNRGLAPRCQSQAREPVMDENANEIRSIQRLARKLQKLAGGGELRRSYQAGPCDHVLERQLPVGDERRSNARPTSTLETAAAARNSVLGGKKAWTDACHKRLGTVRFDSPIDQMVFDQYRLVVEQSMERVAHVTAKLERVSQSSPYAAPVG